MAKAVFTTMIDPTYDDLPEERYHFPLTYLRAVEQTLNDWIVYYRPRRGGTEHQSVPFPSSYFAAARVTRIIRDPTREEHFYAFVSDYLAFDRPVPFREGDKTYESALTKVGGKTNKGAFGRSVRIVPEIEFHEIVTAGFARLLELPHSVPGVRGGLVPGLSEPDQTEFERPIIERLVARPFRETAFAEAVKAAYHQTCAVTGLRIINGGGRAEVQAAHIRPVADRGPDSVRNGLALTGTVHWMFDRGLLSIDDDLTLLTAVSNLPPGIGHIIKPGTKLHVPKDQEQRPARLYLDYHRKEIFKG